MIGAIMCLRCGYRGKTATEMTPDQIAEAQRLAREWMAKHQQ